MRSWRDGGHASAGRRGRIRKGLLALVGSIAVVASVLPATTQATAAPNAQVAAEPSGVSFTLEGCRNNVRGISTDAQGERVTVGWSPPVDGGPVTAYQIQASRDGVRWPSSRISECDPPAPGQPCSPELTAVFNYELTVYETYVFRVSAYNSAGWGPWSEVSPPFTVLPGNRPRVGAPRDVVVTPILRGLRMAWSPPADAWDVSYLVQWSRDGRRWQGASTTRGLRFTFAGLPYGAYAVRVRSQRYDIEYSVWSSTGPVTVPDRRQRLIDFPGLPRHLSSPGTTRLVPCALKTSAGQAVRVGVRTEVRALATRGNVDPVVVRRSPCGRVSITLSGVPVKVWVTLAAPATGRYAELFRTKTYREP